MDKMLFWVSVFTIFLDVFAQTDLDKKVFVFPRESSSDHVNLITKLETPLLFSYNTPGKDNELLIYKEKLGEYSLYIGGTKVTARVPEEILAPVHICTSWESSSGIAEFWINGKPLVKKGLKRGYSVAAHPKIILGQEQDSYGGKFDRGQSFLGEIGDVYMWDSVLSPDDVQAVYYGSYVNGSILNWQALNYELNDYVIIKPRVWD
uniref:Pentraxin family member n=1 Tax=Cavia porcellus TaxID=10141 RepID=H0VFC7_CAVPO